MDESGRATNEFPQERWRNKIFAQSKAQFLPLTIFLLFSSGLSAIASTFDFEFGHWAGRIERDISGRVAACVVSIHNTDDEMLLLRLDGSDYLSLGVFDVSWGPGTPNSNTIVVLVDHKVIRTGVAISDKEGSVMVHLPNAKFGLAAIRDGQMLGAILGDRSAFFNLKGANKAIPFLQTCGKDSANLKAPSGIARQLPSPS